eukprot:TRINITY_DN7092_c0_g1_i2.p1 TRINITY_DN7092_c0_g1~~TRINITY_DN7092_c0_g1_i2.p1  ORF type:complete len:387 (-),score=76.12 TRINITY_DN7092_c0_g1_i2:314-1474(-)
MVRRMNSHLIFLGCIGMTLKQADLVHDVTALKIDPIGKWAQRWSIVQSLDLIDQLDFGVRAIDFRMIWSAPYNKPSTATHDWFINHRMQSAQTAMWYLTRLRDWLRAHPAEIVEIHISRHSDDLFPGTPVAVLHKFYTDFTELFGPLLHNHKQYPSNTTTINELLAAGQRLRAWISDAAVVIPGGSDVINEPQAINTCASVPALRSLTSTFQNAAQACFAGHDPSSTLTPLDLTPDPQNAVYAAAAKVYFAPSILKKGLIKRCAAVMNFSALSGNWCPSNIREYERLENYYNQFLLEKYVANYSEQVMPAYVFVNDLGVNGTITIDEGKQYSLMDTVLLANVQAACTRSPHTDCAALQQGLLERRATHPLQVWNDPDTGREEELPT